VSVAVRRVERRRALLRQYAAPAVCRPLAREREVQAEVCVRVRARVVGDLRQPGAWNHYAARSDEARLERLEGRGVDGVRDAYVVGVNDEQLRVRRIAEPGREGLHVNGRALLLRARARAADVEKRER